MPKILAANVTTTSTIAAIMNCSVGGRRRKAAKALLSPFEYGRKRRESFRESGSRRMRPSRRWSSSSISRS
jgi:hypothetical protein